MDQSTQSNQPPVILPKKSSTLFVVIGFLVLVVAVGAVLGALAWQKNPALFRKVNPLSKPSPTPTSQTEILPIPLSDPLVAGASVSYRLSGTIAEVNQSPDGSLSLKLESQGQVYPISFIVAKDRTVVSLKTGGFAATPSAELQTGDKVELIYLVDLKSKESLVTQVQIK